MKLTNAARFNAVLLLAAISVTLILLSPGLRVVGVQFPRQGWVLENLFVWQLGWWLWLGAIFGWMWLLVGLQWTYLPAHRIASMLQSGLLLIGATLAIAGVVVWMGGLPVAMAQTEASVYILLVDTLALGLIGAGCFMGGIVTFWVGLDLYQQGVLPRLWVVLCLLAGLSAVPTPFLLPFPYHLLVAALCWWLWALYLALLPQLPSPFAEYPSPEYPSAQIQ